MKYIKGFNESRNSKKELDNSIIQFLIHNEKELRIFFNNYTIEKGEHQWEIVAKTKADHSGYKPPMDEVRFPMEEFFNWVSKQTFRGDVFKIKSNLFKEIFDNYDGTKTEPDELDSKLLDSILNQFGVWKLCLSMIKSIRKTISKYDKDDIDDRCLEYFDELSGWKQGFLIGYELCDDIYRSLVDDDISEAWSLIQKIKDIMYGGSTFRNFLTIISSHLKECINIEFNIDPYSEPYEYNEVKKVAVKIYNRLSKLYPIKGVRYAHTYYNDDRYKDRKLPITSYNIVLYIE